MKKKTLQKLIAIVLLFIYLGSVIVLYVNAYAYEKLLFNTEMENIDNAFNDEMYKLQMDVCEYLYEIDENSENKSEDELANEHKEEVLKYRNDKLYNMLWDLEFRYNCDEVNFFMFDTNDNLIMTSGTIVWAQDEIVSTMDTLSVDKITEMKKATEDELDNKYFSNGYTLERIDKFIENANVVQQIMSLDNPHNCEGEKALAKDGIFISDNSYYMYWDDDIDWVYTIGTRNLYKSAFKSQTFFRWMVVETLIFGLLITLSVWAYGKYYDSKIRLERARVAFTKGVAHDMKTPLAIIKNCCECYLDDVAPEKNREYVQSIMEVADRMNEEVISFLSYNRLINQNKIEKDEIDFSKLVQKQVDKHLPFADTRHVRVKCEIEPKVILACDEKMMEVAVGNYLSNAIKYCPGYGKVKVKLDKTGELRVYNDCEELSTEQTTDMWYVLEKGQADRNTSDGSHGMGLPIVSEICRIHNIKCGCKSTPSGVIFYMK